MRRAVEILLRNPCCGSRNPTLKFDPAVRRTDPAATSHPPRERPLLGPYGAAAGACAESGMLDQGYARSRKYRGALCRLRLLDLRDETGIGECVVGSQRALQDHGDHVRTVLGDRGRGLADGLRIDAGGDLAVTDLDLDGDLGLAVRHL